MAVKVMQLCHHGKCFVKDPMNLYLILLGRGLRWVFELLSVDVLVVVLLLEFEI